MTINIASALDDNYVRYTYIMMMSAISNKRPEDEMVFYILYENLLKDNLDLLMSLGSGEEVKVIPIKVDFSSYGEGLYTDDRWTMAIYYRLMLSDILPEGVDRLLYLDGDIIVNKPLNDLFEMDFEGKLLIGSEDFLLRSDKNLSEVQIAALEEDMPYICSGVILFDMKNYRTKYSLMDYLVPLKELPINFKLPDQDLINLVHGDEIKLVDKYKYHLFPKQAFNEGYTYKKIKEEVSIIHFASQKPWNGQFVHCETEQIWWDYANKAPFFDELAKEYIGQAVNNSYVYDTISKLMSDNKKLREEIALHKELNDKLLSILNIDNDESDNGEQ